MLCSLSQKNSLIATETVPIGVVYSTEWFSFSRIKKHALCEIRRDPKKCTLRKKKRTLSLLTVYAGDLSLLPNHMELHRSS